MLTLPECDIETSKETPTSVMLADGSCCTLEGLSKKDLHELQWTQEQKFARAICAMPKGSEERALITSQAYDTICTILAAQQEGDGPLVMGLDNRYVGLVLELLQKQVKRGLGQPRLFEVGFGSGAMLKEVQDHGYPIGGLEVSATMREEAIQVLGERHASQLLLGDLQKLEIKSLAGQPSLIYWNDVFEHICPDEINDYLNKLYKMLAPGGSLVTITPNWLLRPSDVTGDFRPQRTEAAGLHLKEYSLSEVTALLKQAGFQHISTPLVVSKKRIYLAGGGGRWIKQLVEPLLDRLPIRIAHLLCRGWGMSCTVATKSNR